MKIELHFTWSIPVDEGLSATATGVAADDLAAEPRWTLTRIVVPSLGLDIPVRDDVSEIVRPSISRALAALKVGATVLEVDWRVSLLFVKWVMALHFRADFLARGKNSDLAHLTIGGTYAQHNLGHHGECAHTLRFWLRGGDIGLVASGTSADAPAEQWCELADAISSVRRYERIATELGTLARGVDRTKLKVVHSDLHHFQVPSRLDEFTLQLHAEFCFPALLRRAARSKYEAIKAEIGPLLVGKNIGAIVWVRNVTASTSLGANRQVRPEELQGCVVAAIAVAKEVITRPDVLALGDKGGLASCSGSSLSKVTQLLDLHRLTRGGAKRTQLEQALFLAAVVEVSGAKLVVGERAGLIDKIAFCGGIACVQFIGQDIGHEDDPRLPGVCASGCSMGATVSLVGRTSVRAITERISEAAERAVAERVCLETELPRTVDGMFQQGTNTAVAAENARLLELQNESATLIQAAIRGYGVRRDLAKHGAPK